MPGVRAGEFTVADLALLARPGSTSQAARSFSISRPRDLSAFDISRSTHILGWPIAVAKGDQMARVATGINFIKFSCRGHGRVAETCHPRSSLQFAGLGGPSESLDIRDVSALGAGGARRPRPPQPGGAAVIEIQNGWPKLASRDLRRQFKCHETLVIH